MENPNNSNNFMKKLSEFIVDKRKAFYLIFAIAFIFCVKSIDKVKINNDITSYLPDDTETRQGVDIMANEFKIYSNAQIMISNISLEKANEFKEKFSEIDGVLQVVFDGTGASYKDSSAMMAVMFKGFDDDEIVQNAMNTILEELEGYDHYIISTLGYDQAAILESEMQTILIIAVIVIIGVLLFTSKSYLEIIVYLIVFGVSAVLNMGTNFIFGEISFITNSIAIVLQLALAIDYAIIFCHRYMEEREKMDAREAVIESLSKAIIEISSSSLTTISGLVALMLMQLKIGFDMGIVLSKGILCSLITVFLLMPGLLMLFSKGIDKTRHRSFVPKISLWGKLMVKTRYILPAIFAVILVGAAFFQLKCDFVFSTNSMDLKNKNAPRIAQDKITEVFGNNNMIAMMVPNDDYEKQKAVVNEILELEEITSATSLSNIMVDDVHSLTDRLTPRQFSELADIDIELARLLYQAYGVANGEYGVMFQDVDEYSAPLIKVFLFLFEQKEKGIVTFPPEQDEMLTELYDQLKFGMDQMEGKEHSNLVFVADIPEEGEETYELLEKMRGIAQKYYDEPVIMVGNSTSAKDLSESFTMDNIKISVLTVLFVMLILLFTFKSVGLPIMLIATIQGSIFINFSFPYLTGTNMYFLGYLIVSAIQMGATIDYAIVITNRYQDLKTKMSSSDAIIETLNQAFPTIFTSGTIMTVAGFLIGGLSTEPIIASFGTVLGRGTLISIILVMTVLPQILYLGDKIIEKTAITISANKNKTYRKDIVVLDGRIKGKVSGYVDGEFKGVITGDINAQLDSNINEENILGKEDFDNETTDL